MMYADGHNAADRIRYVLAEHYATDNYGRVAVEVVGRLVDALADIVADEVAAALHDAGRS